jgi:DNA-directed RNA polymerase specialized sigma24 family protein
MNQVGAKHARSLDAELPEVFNDRFVRCLRLLYLIAGRVLGGPENAAEAVRNCYATAANNPPRFQHEGEFRSWLLRVLINEALGLLRTRDFAGAYPPGNFAPAADPHRSVTV